jgi:hypothetical protein
MRIRAGSVAVLVVAGAMGAGGCQWFGGRGGEVAGRIAQPASVLTVDFEAVPAGRLPAGVAVAQTGQGEPPAWKVLEVPGAPSGRKALAQTSADPTSQRYPLCVCDSPSAADVFVGVRFQCVSGKVDRAAGIVIRYRDANNYYVARANALEDNVRFYKVVDGKRSEIAGMNVPVTSGPWHTLSVRSKGGSFQVTMDNKSFQVEDATFAAPGLCGLWTKADSVTFFDDLKIESYDGK